jgi:hypothetical protein
MSGNSDVDTAIEITLAAVLISFVISIASAAYNANKKNQLELSQPKARLLQMNNQQMRGFSYQAKNEKAELLKTLELAEQNIQ